NMSGKFNITAMNRFANISAAITNYLASCTADVNGNCVVPLELEGTTNGTVKMFGINITSSNLLLKATISNDGNKNLELKKVAAIDNNGAVCELTPQTTILTVGDFTSVESSDCSFTCPEIASIKVTTTCGVTDEYKTTIVCS
ncbi:MAG: hypothetical protein KAS12_05080, partial [Candidatus Aenigmarchaeota archaeon]|nr:hypothetical protein [Candidatus Aenigmarchaeota archaeon]